ncbi:MAG: nucleoside hydrolase-like domain-containing protein [Candidatus Brocadiia bacterium]
MSGPAMALAVGLSLVAAVAMGATQPPGGALAGQRPRVVVSTDVGGSDPDDFQSMVHLLVYADVLDLEGLISSPPKGGRKKHLLECIEAYEKDYPNVRRHSGRYPTPDALRAMARQGAVDPAPKQGYRRPTEGSRWLIQRAEADDPRPLYVLVWGSITDVAQAVHDRPGIKKRIRVYSIASWNRRQDPAARDYLFDHHRDLWWIEADTTFRGMYMGGNQEGDLGNRAFVEHHVRGHGALGALFWSKKRDIKMGDTPAVLYLLRGEPGEPTAPHWGGAFVPTDHGPAYWTDSRDPELRDHGKWGAKTVSRWREAYLRDWQARMDRLLAPGEAEK